MQVRQELVLAVWHVAHGYWHKTQLEPSREAGEAHEVQLLALPEQVAQEDKQGVHTVPSRKVPLLQTVQAELEH